MPDQYGLTDWRDPLLICIPRSHWNGKFAQLKYNISRTYPFSAWAEIQSDDGRMIIEWEQMRPIIHLLVDGLPALRNSPPRRGHVALFSGLMIIISPPPHRGRMTCFSCCVIQPTGRSIAAAAAGAMTMTPLNTLYSQNNKYLSPHHSPGSELKPGRQAVGESPHKNSQN